MKKDNNYLAINIRVSDMHPDKKFQSQMIGLFKHNAYERNYTQAEFMEICMSKLYQIGFLDPEVVMDHPDQELLDDIMVSKYESE